MTDSVNWIAILVAVLASMIIGAAWFGLLAKQWMKAGRFTVEEIASIEANEHPSNYAIAVVTHVVMAWVLSGIIAHAGDITLLNGMLVAFLCWLGFVVTSTTVSDRFQLRSWSLTVIDCGHYLTVMLAQGAILGWFGAS